MPKMLLELNDEQDEKVKYFQHIFELKHKWEAVLKIIDLTKIKPLDKKPQQDEILKAFRGE